MPLWSNGYGAWAEGDGASFSLLETDAASFQGQWKN